MGKKVSNTLDNEFENKKNLFIKNIDSDMHFVSNYLGNSLKFDWVDEVEKACPFIDHIVRMPKLTLIKDEVLVPPERAKRIMVDSIKDLAKHTNRIEEEPDENGDVMPKKILDIRSEETFNIYENRFLYTLIADLDRFVYQKEQLLKNFNLIDEKKLEYAADTSDDAQKISRELKITSTTIPKETQDSKLKKSVEDQLKRIKGIREYITSWQRSAMVNELDKAHVQFVKPPLKPTNILLKSANFQVASKLWEYIRNYDLDNTNASKNDIESSGNQTLLSFLDDAFLKDYFVLDSISKKKREEKEKICKSSVTLLAHEIYQTLNLLLDNGYKTTEDELLNMIAEEMQTQKNNRLVGIEDIKKKFKSEIDEYLERMQNL